MTPRRGKEISVKNRYLVDCALALFKIGVRVPEFPQLRKLMDVGYLSELLRRLRVNCVVDVGAHNGTYAYHLRRAGYSGEILSFEPVKEQFMQITRLSHGDPAWRSFGYALGSDDKTGEFNVIKSGTERHVLSSLLDPDWDNLKLLADQTTDRHLERKEVVHIRRLDSILSELLPHNAPRLFLKVDTQGYDLEVIKGAAGVMQHIVGLQSELSVTPIYKNMPHYTKCLEYYESLGFSLMHLALVNRTRQGNILEYDCLMARLPELNGH